MADSELTLKVAVSMTPGVTADVVRAMCDCGVSLDEFFSLGMQELSDRLGANRLLRLEKVAREEALFKARQEIAFMQKHSIRAVFLGDEDYPPMLYELPDAPVLLYVLGSGTLSPEQALAVVGTRRCTAYGTSFVKSLLADLVLYYPDMAVVSGLAYGIDAAAHTGALENHLQTIAVVAHGLDMMYPAAHRSLARQIVEAGGAIVTEYPRGTTPYQRNFLERNRIVAGLCGATLVVESELRGGAMSTANQAFVNNRDVLALPGRATDLKSAGCNHLIRTNKASMVTCAADVTQITGWVPYTLKSVPKQRNLFPELSGDVASVYNVLKQSAAPMSVDAIHQHTGIGIKDLMPILTEMEFDGMVTKLPGSRYETV